MNTNYHIINNSSDFFIKILDILKSTGNYTLAQKKDNNIVYIGDNAEIYLKRYILSDGFELFLNNCNIKKMISFPVELNYDALDIRVFVDKNSNELSGGAKSKFLFYKNKNSRQYATFPVMNKMFMSLYINCNYLSQYIDLTPYKINEDNKNWNKINISNHDIIYSILKQVTSTNLEGDLLKLYYQGKAMELTSIIVDILKNNVKFNHNFKINDDKYALKKAREIIGKHYCEILTIEDISKKIYKNKTWLKRNYKESYGTTIRQDIIVHRMNKALQLLSVENLSVEKTSKKIGYEHLGHFISTFRKHFGYTPSEYIKLKK